MRIRLSLHHGGQLPVGIIRAARVSVLGGGGNTVERHRFVLLCDQARIHLFTFNGDGKAIKMKAVKESRLL